MINATYITEAVSGQGVHTLGSEICAYAGARPSGGQHHCPNATHHGEKYEEV